MHFYALTRLRARRELIKRGYRRSEVSAMMDCCDDGLIDSAVEASDVQIPRGKIGDGTIIKAILDFLSSEAGQKLIDALIKLLTSFI